MNLPVPRRTPTHVVLRCVPADIEEGQYEQDNATATTLPPSIAPSPRTSTVEPTLPPTTAPITQVPTPAPTLEITVTPTPRPTIQIPTTPPDLVVGGQTELRCSLKVCRK